MYTVLYFYDLQFTRGGGYGLGIPYEYMFEGDLFSITWLKNKLIKEEFLGKERSTFKTNFRFIFGSVSVIWYCTSAYCGHLKSVNDTKRPSINL